MGTIKGAQSPTEAMNRELNFSGPSPILYLVATPIGNLSEFSPRAIEVVKSCDYVAAEDTRNSGKLLSLFSIKKPFISCHEHNEEESSSKIVSLLKEGKKVCYMSDAGYPAISDPGSRLVANCLSNGIKVATVSGPNAALNALASSGLDSTHFYFFGFLSAKEGDKAKELDDLKKRRETIILYESPHRIKRTLQSLYDSFGDRQAVIGRELTKAHEEFIRGTLDEFVSLDEETLKGEMVIVIEGAKQEEKPADEETIKQALLDCIKAGLSGKDAVEKTAKSLQVRKKAVYSLYLELNQK